MARAPFWVSLGWLSVVCGCQVNVPSGVFGCDDDNWCPTGQYCHPDGICRGTRPKSTQPAAGTSAGSTRMDAPAGGAGGGVVPTNQAGAPAATGQGGTAGAAGMTSSAGTASAAGGMTGAAGMSVKPCDPPCRHWRGATALDTPESAPAVIRHQLESNGTARVVWSVAVAPGVSDSRVRASSFTPGVGFAPLQQLATGMGGLPLLALCMNARDQPLLIEQDYMGAVFGFQLESGVWGSAKQLAPAHSGGRTGLPKCVALSDGSALAVWIQPTMDGTRKTLFGTRHTEASAWSSLQQAEQESTAAVASYGLAAQADNKAWLGWSDDKNRVLVKQFSVASGWGSATELRAESSNDVSVASFGQILADERGRALTLWSNTDAATQRPKIVARSYDGSTWSRELVALEANSYGVANNRDGQMFVVSEQQVAANRVRIFARQQSMGGALVRRCRDQSRVLHGPERSRRGDRCVWQRGRRLDSARWQRSKRLGQLLHGRRGLELRAEHRVQSQRQRVPPRCQHRLARPRAGCVVRAATRHHADRGQHAGLTTRPTTLAARSRSM